MLAHYRICSPHDMLLKFPLYSSLQCIGSSLVPLSKNALLEGLLRYIAVYIAQVMTNPHPFSYLDGHLYSFFICNP